MTVTSPATGYVLLTLAVVSYAAGIVAQTVAARRTEMREHLDTGLLARLARDRIFLAGFTAQVVGFGLATLSRATLPLYLVQAMTAAAVGLAAVTGVLLLGWRVRPVEIVVLALMGGGLVLMVTGAASSVAYDMSTPLLLVLVAILALTAALAVPASRLRGARGAVALGSLAGVAFAVLAVASRPLADEPSPWLVLDPGAWVMIAGALLGQTLMVAGFQRGSSTATAASMDATSTVLAAAVGLALLGDRITAGHEVGVIVGLTLVIGAVVALAVISSTTPAPTLPALDPSDPLDPSAPSGPDPVPGPRTALEALPASPDAEPVRGSG